MTEVPTPALRPPSADQDGALVELIGPEDAPLLLRSLYAEGDPGPIVAALAQVPELCQVTLPFVAAALGPSAVSARLKEIAILRTSSLLSCRYCVDTHTVVALDTGLTLEEVRALRGEVDTTEVFTDPAEIALVRYVDALATGKGPVDRAITGPMTRRFADHLVVELTVTVGATLLLNRMATALGLPTSTETLGRLAAAGLGRR